MSSDMGEICNLVNNREAEGIQDDGATDGEFYVGRQKTEENEFTSWVV